MFVGVLPTRIIIISARPRAGHLTRDVIANVQPRTGTASTAAFRRRGGLRLNSTSTKG